MSPISHHLKNKFLPSSKTKEDKIEKLERERERERGRSKRQRGEETVCGDVTAGESDLGVEPGFSGRERREREREGEKWRADGQVSETTATGEAGQRKGRKVAAAASEKKLEIIIIREKFRLR
ncbi:hypothetical protein RUM43_012606 [Polyplax serrata]|uniref:Uncharacterized protein n=1 Tax=Polyplax serrata TaxID=468196 RepID=A0AAN8P5C9_POLSC